MKEKHKRGNQLKAGDFLFYLGVCVFHISVSCHMDIGIETPAGHKKSILISFFFCSVCPQPF